MNEAISAIAHLYHLQSPPNSFSFSLLSLPSSYPSFLPQTAPMGKIDQAVIDDFDSLAVALGSTPKFNNQNEIIPIGARDPRGKVYVVWVGRGIGLFYNWCVPKSLELCDCSWLTSR